MIIREVSCDQFAGLRSSRHEFANGLNLIIGENESGKSTLVDLLYHLFFQNAAIDGRKDKSFVDRYFPKTTDDYQGDTIDGTVRFQTEKGVYTLSKEFSGKNSSCKLILPKGTVIRDINTINNILSEALVYGKGVYDELVFASQRRQQTVLKGLLGNESSQSVAEVASILTKAVMETGGIDIDAIQQELSDTLKSFEGRWDFSTDLPQGGRNRGINNRWVNGAGRILNAYYNKEQIAQQQYEAEKAEKEVESINAVILDKKSQLEELKDRRERFLAVRSNIASINSNKALLEEMEKDLKEMKTDQQSWPQKLQQLSEANQLKEQIRQAELKEKHAEISQLIGQRNGYLRDLDPLGEISAEEMKKALSLEKEIAALESELKGINLTARIRKLGERDVEITSALTGEMLHPETEEFDITEAVRIFVPETVDIQLSAKGVDGQQAGRKLLDDKAELNGILKMHDVENAEQLSEKREQINELQTKLQAVVREIRDKLDGGSWQQLEDEAGQIPDDIRSLQELKKEAAALSGDSLEAFIGMMTGQLSTLETRYGSSEQLGKNIREKQHSIIELSEKIARGDEMPEEFRNISDTDGFDSLLKKQIETQEKDLDEIQKQLSAAERNLKDRSAEEYSEDLADAQKAFEEEKKEYYHWKNINDVFIKVKQAANGDPLVDIVSDFQSYLSTLSDGKLVLGSMQDNLHSSITSDSNRLTSDILSEGTKDTISLAFRLAVLNHLFPSGGAVAVFDDPFTDMDPKRTAQGCALIEKFAENNQVIFVSCDEKYEKLLNGNLIRI